MIVCKHCTTKNGIDSRFCASCGLELTDEDRDRAKAELDKLVAEGYALLGQGRTEEAALVAEKSLEEAPHFAEALSLLGMCHERNHDTLAALTCYERVVELRPDSALDKIKVQQLRNQLARGAKEDRPNRAFALVGAIAAVIAVASIGGIVATMVARPATASDISETPGTQAAGTPFTRQEPIVQKAPDTTETKPTTNEDPAERTVNPNQGGLTRRIDGGAGTGVLPDVNGPRSVADSQGDGGNAPFKIPGGVEVVQSGGGTINPDDPKPDDDKSKDNVAAAAPDPEQGIEIKVHRNTSLGGSEPANGGEQSLTVLMKAAREQFILGKYSSAATMYEKALGSGGDSGSINQRLGQCYERMGKTSEAIAAYSRAERALEGRGSKTALEAVRQALQNLRGN